MDIFQAIILAVVQGLTEFLPISSSAHLILVPELLGWNANGLAFDVAVHVGTLLAVLAFLRQELQQIIPAWLAGWKGFNWDNEGMLGWMMVIGTVPLGLVGIASMDYIEQSLRTPLIIAISTLLFGLLLGWSDRNAEQNQGELKSLSFTHTLLIGGAQAFALIPGTSRSGVTMTALLALGYSRMSAAKFSFLLAIPAIALPGALKSYELATSDLQVVWMPILVGAAVSAVVSFLTMSWFISFVTKIGMKPFVIYRILLAAVIFAVLV